MNYDEHRAKFWDEYNPFSFNTIEKELIIDESKYSFVLANRWPYTDDHLLVIPKREVHFLLDMTEEERSDIYIMIEKRLEKLYKKYSGINILMRDWYFSKTWRNRWNYCCYWAN